MQILWAAFSLGVLYSLMAIGFALIYSVVHIVNLSYGGFYAAGAYIVYLMSNYIAVTPALLVIPALPILAFAAFLQQKVVIDKMIDHHLNVFVVTLFFMVLIENSLHVAFGPLYKRMPPFYSGTLSIWGVSIEIQSIWIVIASMAALGLLVYIVQKTALGRSMRGVKQDDVACALLGVNVSRVRRITAVIGMCLAGLAGVLISPLRSVHYSMGSRCLHVVFVATVFGGLGSLKGAFVGAIFLGMMEVLVGYYVSPLLPDIIGSLVVILTLIIRPRGLFGEKE